MIALVAREPFAPIHTAPPALPPLLSAIRITSGVRTGGLETWPCPYCGALHLHDGGADPEFAPYGLHPSACQGDAAHLVNATGYVLVPPRFRAVAQSVADQVVASFTEHPGSADANIAIGFAHLLLHGGAADGWIRPDGPSPSATNLLRWAHWLSTARTGRWFDLAAQELRADATNRCWHALRIRFHGNLAVAFAETGLTPHHEVALEILGWYLPWMLPPCGTKCPGELETVATIKRFTNGTVVPKPTWTIQVRSPRRNPGQRG